MSLKMKNVLLCCLVGFFSLGKALGFGKSIICVNAKDTTEIIEVVFGKADGDQIFFGDYVLPVQSFLEYGRNIVVLSENSKSGYLLLSFEKQSLDTENKQLIAYVEYNLFSVFGERVLRGEQDFLCSMRNQNSIR